MDWAARIKRAGRKGEFTAIDRRLASEWLTCAVGEKTYVKGRRTEEARLVSHKLQSLGVHFMWNVGSNDISAAKRVYQQIQDYKE